MAARSPSVTPARSKSLAHYGNDSAQMLAGSKLRLFAAIPAVGRHLRRNHRRQHVDAVFHHGGGGFIARRFDAENEHSFPSTARRTGLRQA